VLFSKVFPKGEILFRSFKERVYIERESVASSSPTSPESSLFTTRRRRRSVLLGSFRALAGHAREREKSYTNESRGDTEEEEDDYEPAFVDASAADVTVHLDLNETDEPPPPDD